MATQPPQQQPQTQPEQKEEGDREDLNADPTSDGEEEMDVPFELTVHLPDRPLIPASAALSGLPDIPSPLKIAVQPNETLNEVRMVVTEFTDGYWLGAFCFRGRAAKASTANGKANGKSSTPQLGKRLSEWVPLKELFAETDEGKEEVFIHHVPFNDAEARNHVLRLRNLLYETYPNPSDVGIDQGITVHDAIKNPKAWLEETVQTPISSVAAKGKKGGKAQDQTSAPTASSGLVEPFAGWEKWASSPLSNFIPPQAHSSRSLVTCLRAFGIASWTVPPQQLRSLGHFFYLHVVTLEGDTLYLTASAHGFYVNKSTSTRFDPYPKTPGQTSCSLVDLLCFLSPLFLSNFGKIFKDPLTERDLAATAPNGGRPAFPWLARETPHHPDVMRSQLAFLHTGATSIETLESTRDWHDELQQAREQPQKTVAERLFRERYINRVYSEYTLAAIRAIPRVAAGEVQPMNPNDKPEAHMFLANNLFISRGADSVGVYPLLGGDEAAHVAVGKDVRNTCVVNTIDPEGLCTLGSVVIDWLGTRWVAQSVVPGLFRQKAPEEENEFLADVAEAKEKEAKRTPEENEEKKVSLASRKADLSEEVSYRYGAADGPEVIRDSPAFHSLFEQVAKSLHLALHDVEDAKKVKHSLWLSVECKGLRGADGRKYILDLARLMPVDIEWLENDMEGQVFDSDSSKLQDSDDKSVYPHKMTLLRPELLQDHHEAGLRKWVGAQVKELEAKREAEKKKAEEGQEEKEDAEEKEESEKKQERIDASQFKLEYNPDAFVEFKLGGSSAEAQEEKDPQGIVLVSDESDPSVAAVRSASKFLREEVIPGFLSEVLSGVLVLVDGHVLTRQMQSRGINVRYLGYLAQLSTPSQNSKLDQAVIAKFGPGYEGLLRVFHEIVVQEMVVRAAKRVLRSLLKNVEESAGTFFTSTGACVSHFFNCLLGFSREPSPAAVFESSPLYLDSQPPSWTEITPSGIQETIRAEVKKRYRFSLPTDYFFTSLRKQQVLRAVCLRTGVQLKLQDYHFEASANANGHAQETSEESVNETPAATTTLTKKKKGKKSKASAGVEAELQRKPRTTTFQPSDILNLVPIVKDSAPRCSLAEQTFESGRLTLSRATTVDDRHTGFELLGQGLQFYEQVYGTIHSEIAKVFQVYASLLHTFTALQNRERQVKIARAEIEGKPEPTEDEFPSHPDVNTANALRYQRLALTICERTYGLDSVEALTAYNTLGAYERAEGQIENALRSHARSLELFDFIHGAAHDHPEGISILTGIGVTMYNGGKNDQAITFLREAYSAALRLYGPDSLQTGNLAHELAQAYTLARDLKAGVMIEKEALRIFEARLGKDDPTTKDANQFLLSLTNAAVQMAKSEKERQSRNAARGLPVLGSSNQRASAAREATSAAAAQGANKPSIDELVNFIENGKREPLKPSAGSKGKKVSGGK